MTNATDNDAELGTGGGAATNSGIDYQQRVSAWFLTVMFTRVEFSALLGLDGKLVVEKITYENAECVDDLSLIVTVDVNLFIQIKRRLSFSSTEESDWVKTLDQFVRQHLTKPGKNNYLLLATSPESSSRITRVVKKLADSVRLNPKALVENPWTKAEQQTLTELRTLVGRLYKQYAGVDLGDAEFVTWLGKVYVIVMDVEHGRPHESVAVALLLPTLRVAPQLIWALLVKNSLHYAKSRSSIDSTGLEATLDPYCSTDRGGGKREMLPVHEQWRLTFQGAGRISSGREYILIDSVIPDVDLLVLELIRFDEKCERRVKFTSSTLLWGPEAERTESKVYCRAATLEGVRRRYESTKSQYGEKSLAILAANVEAVDAADDSHCSKLHADLCDHLVRERANLDLCVHCGRHLSQHLATMVELDDLASVPSVGGAHDECLRAVDRIIGRMELEFFREYPHLKRFDVGIWATQLLKGQRAFNDVGQAKAPFGPTTVMVWNPENEASRDYDYCVEIRLQDTSVWHMTSRGKLDRLPKTVAKTRATEWNRQIQLGRADQNPHCYTSVTRRYGQYSRLLTLKEPDEECVESEYASAVRYTENIGRNYSTDVHFYAPLVRLVQQSDEAWFAIGGHVVLLSNPLAFPRYMSNWAAADIDLGDYEMRIIPTDVQFDLLMSDAIAMGLRVVVNPILDKRGSLVQGILVFDIDTALAMNGAK